ncbi:MAG TPA: hypothetical protein PLK46_11350 [Propioniciclava sp.]|uniref:ParB family protein n=1 Tax=Propioniciclava sp. TaxID=2038686 RepID=UPI002CD6DA9C|nr:hypothetical protein [Propioniciclava sp.]HRL80912.1 hypothetical protein [Propioniciclava sp.]
MSRPERRMSSLTGANPVAPPAPAETQPAPAAQPVEVAVPAEQPATPPADLAIGKPGQGKTTKQPGKKYPNKVSFYQDPEDTDRIRGAILHTMVSEGNRTLSQFMQKVSMAEVERLEALYNGGKPFPSVKPGDLPQGAAAHDQGGS